VREQSAPQVSQVWVWGWAVGEDEVPFVVAPLARLVASEEEIAREALEVVW
jgi:hypothetical protein